MSGDEWTLRYLWSLGVYPLWLLRRTGEGEAVVTVAYREGRKKVRRAWLAETRRPALASTVGWCYAVGWLERVEGDECYTVYVLTEAGRAALAEAERLHALPSVAVAADPLDEWKAEVGA